ncbi:NADH-quinone oxidoreductase subunit A [Candidatus Xenohaliotis californiensis]|uniref:NADH-quinone oxidoreductase subunit n=1 Tax=Candidatus Xenohaliotis californiensis TaxID=84677 RepID=A0ABP0EWU8_9RICK|nr:NADH-quinone oxidoreductase subunit A [Candidatus Xenohaliotis californiensis]
MFKDLNYSYILLFLIATLILSICAFILPSVLTSRNKNTKLSNDHYECGIKPFSNTVNIFHIKFYLVAVLFVLFDVEVTFLIPWVTSLGSSMYYGFISMMIFSSFMAIGFLYEWYSGVLEW